MNKKILTIFTGYIFVYLLGVLACDNCGPSPDKFKVTSLDWHINKAIYSETIQPKLILSEIRNDTALYSEYSKA
jgi:hypothetical protein